MGNHLRLRPAESLTRSCPRGGLSSWDLQPAGVGLGHLGLVLTRAGPPWECLPLLSPGGTLSQSPRGLFPFWPLRVGAAWAICSATSQSSLTVSWQARRRASHVIRELTRIRLGHRLGEGRHIAVLFSTDAWSAQARATLAASASAGARLAPWLAPAPVAPVDSACLPGRRGD